MTQNPLRIVFMGTPVFSVPALEKLIQSPHKIVAVYTQPPRPKGRGHTVHKSPVHTVADSYSIPVFTPVSFKKDKDALETFKSHDADLAIVAAYGLILPPSILETPTYGCLNIHASLLPRWRGAAPIQYAIWKGDTESGITIMQMEAGLDTGPMIAKQSCPITQETDVQSLHNTLSTMGSQMLLPLLNQLNQEHSLPAEPQDEALSTYASMLKKDDGQIDWTQTAQEIDQQIRALNPWPKTYSTISTDNISTQLKIKKVRITDQISNASIGTLLDKKGRIVCGKQSVIQLIEVQPDNKNIMNIESAFNGGYLKIGAIFQ